MPFLAIVAMLALLMIMEPDGSSDSDELLGAGGSLDSGPATDSFGTPADESGGLTAGDDAGSVGTETPAGGEPTGGGGTEGGAPGGAAPEEGGTGGGEPAPGGGPAAPEGQRVDGLGRPLDGDKSKCAPDGLLQENITSFSLPCMPAFVGDNGGTTYQGVTAQEIKIVVLVQHFQPAVQQALLAVGLAATDQQYAEASEVFANFMNKRYELYGRKITPIIYSQDCEDNPCFRAEAKAAIAKHKPFAVVWFIPGIAPEAFMDEVTRQRIPALGATGLPTEWFVQRRPYAWTEVAQSPISMDNLADYYCKKMWGKNATQAGDPTLRIKRRKLGIIVVEEPNNIEAAKHFRKQVSGGMCGSPSDGTQLYTISSDTDTAEAQRPTLVARMKNDGITTSLQLPSTDVLGCAECDRQRYFPEHLISGQNQNDADIVGRLDASAQRGNRFGLGFRPKPVPLDQHDFRRAARDVNPNYEPTYITEGPYLSLTMIGRMIQLAGPRLTPATMEQGAHTMPQLGGYSNPNPWPGWKCCNPSVPKWSLAGQTKYSAWSDAREIYWDDSAISPDDGRPGAWVCVAQCKRFEAGQWPKGEPKQQ
jgi:hypothetical protein